MKKITVFLGPSLSIKEAKTYLSNAFFKPPAKRGDITVEKNLKTDVICLIDGLFYEQASVGHKEILYALKNGIQIFGSSSMGALRAYEMEKYGMVGIGKVYELYKNGFIDSDDEVAILYDPFNYTQLTEALVDIRATLLFAVNKNIITNRKYNSIIRYICSIHYSQRTYEYIFENLKFNKILKIKKLEKLEHWIYNNNSISIKRLDCIKLLKYINIKYNQK